ncbi:MAG: insulinase family protein [Spirochaetales bacterium]|nr:insulinase family protein [Spirochaetales bacterium]
MSTLATGQRLKGFLVTAVRQIPEFKGTAIHLIHEVTGCRVFHFLNDSEENVFSFNFKTPPPDNTGVPHILEHSVLSGSRKYPIKDPFISLMNGSVQTYLNASTYPDMTIYPGATVLKKDYFNLMSVYGDAVFFPLLTRQTFLQEGCRVDVNERGEASFQGVVFSEMQGAYASLDSIAAEWSVRSLFPDSPLGFDYGGAPEAIPSLTYEEFVEFHRKYYHPSNCRIFLYGNISTEEQCDFLQREFLHAFADRRDPAVLPVAERWEAPRILEKTSPLTEGQDEKGKTTILLNYRTLPASDPVALLTLEILAEALMGNEGSPLTKVVQDSGLGEDLSPVSGLETHLPEALISIGIRGSEAEHRAAFEELILKTLEDLADQGIPQDVLEGACRTVEFRNREIRGGIPFGLRLLGKALRGWMNGADPETTMLFKPWMEEVKKRMAQGPYFETCIRDLLLNNPHRSTLIVRPDKDHAFREQEQLSTILREQTGQDKGLLEEMARQTGEFYRLQEEGDPPDAAVPCLGRNDLPRDIRRIATRTGSEDGISLYSHELFTNGVVYMDLLLDVGGLTPEASKLLPFFSRLITSTGLPGQGYDEVARDLALYTGGLYSSLESNYSFPRPTAPSEYLLFRVKALEESLDKALDLVFRLLSEGVLDDPRRIADLSAETRNDFRSGFLDAGHSLAALRAAGRLTATAAREETWRGISQFLYLEDLASSKPDPALMEALQSLRRQIFTRDRIRLHAAGDGKVVDRALRRALRFAAGLPAGGPRTDSFLSPERLTMESLVAQSSVGFAAVVFPASILGTEEHPAEALLGRILTTGFLWEHVRMRGGAYGVSAGANGSDGLFSMTSYRDPRVEQTLTTFRKALEIAASGNLTEEDLEKAVITAVGRELRPLSPGEESITGLRRSLYGITDELRLEKHRKMLQMDTVKLKRAAEGLLENYRQGTRAVLGGRSLIDKIIALHPEAGETITVLPV